MKHFETGNSNPEAYITKDKQRVKQFDKHGTTNVNRGLVYLSNGDNFEIEIFNPTSNHILAQISLDGNSISRAGLVLRPGERVFLERYIDTNNKFIYSTYEVNGGNKQVQNAIAMNGLIKVEFFNEQPPQPIYYGGNTTLTVWPPIYHYPYVTPNIFYSSGINSTISTSGVNTLSSGGQGATTATYSCNCNSNSVLGSNKSSVTTDSLSFMDMSQANMELPKSFPPEQSRKIETGTVEKGESSKQSFKTSDRNFQYSSFYTVEWKIIPKSQQPITSNDLKQYCTECGAKIMKPTFKFCPNCGEKIGS